MRFRDVTTDWPVQYNGYIPCFSEWGPPSLSGLCYDLAQWRGNFLMNPLL
jgi:hypothetical protein